VRGVASPGDVGLPCEQEDLVLHGLLPLGGERCAGGAEPATRHGGQGTRRDSREHCLAAKRVVDIGNMAPEGNREMQAAAPLVAAVLAPAGSSLAPLVLAPAAERDARDGCEEREGAFAREGVGRCGEQQQRLERVSAAVAAEGKLGRQHEQQRRE